MDEQPLREDKAIYHRKLVSLGSGKATARLFPDRVEVTDALGSQIASFPVASITDVKQVKGGTLRIRCGEDLHALSFVLGPYRMMGLLGILASGGGAKAKAWGHQLSELGMHVRKGTF